MNFTEFDERIAEAWDRGIDPETGEILDEAAIKEVEALEMDRAELIKNFLLWVVNMELQSAGMAEYIKTRQDLKSRLDRKHDSVKRYIQKVLNGEKFTSPEVSVSYRHTKAVQIDDADAIPQEFLNYKVETPPDKTKIAAALKAGAVVPGCSLKENVSMTIK